MEKLIFVNAKKHSRAKDLFDLLAGRRVAKTRGEEDTKAKMATLIATDKVDMEDEDGVVLYIYQKFGGLVRTPAEQKAADLNKIGMQKKGKKKMFV